MKEWRGEAVKQRMGEGVLPFTPSFLTDLPPRFHSSSAHSPIDPIHYFTTSPLRHFTP